MEVETIYLATEHHSHDMESLCALQFWIQEQFAKCFKVGYGKIELSAVAQNSVDSLQRGQEVGLRDVLHNVRSVDCSARSVSKCAEVADIADIVNALELLRVENLPA